MPLDKKAVVTIISLFLFSTCFSGCILEDLFGGTSFDLESWSVTDTEGFPALSLFFSSNDKIILKVYNVDSVLTDSEFFYSDTNTTMNIGDFQETLSPGNYMLRVYGKDGNEIYQKQFSFSGTKLSILSCDQKWWKNDELYSLIGLSLQILNNGDVSAYPYSVNITAGSETVEGLVLPNTIAPSSSSTVYCYLYHKDVFQTNDFTVTLKDKADNILASGTFDFDVESNIPTRYYTDGLDNRLSIPYPDFLYDYYRSLDRIYVEDYSLFVFDEYDEIYIDLLIDRIISTLNFDEFEFNLKTDAEKINYMTSFVQSLDYKLDSDINDSFEYPRYPVETIFNGAGGGDCEDKAILAANLLKNLGYQTALFRLPEHMAVGVKLDEEDIPNHEYYTDQYYYVETTTPGSECGSIPKKWLSPSELTVYSLDDRAFIYHNWKNDLITIYKNTEQGDIIKAVCYVTNLGRKTAEDVFIQAVFVTDDGLELSSKNSPVDTIQPGEKKKIVISIVIPEFTSWFETRAVYNGEIIDIEKSKNTFPRE